MFICLIPLFQKVRIHKLLNYVEGICILNNVAMEIGKIYCFSYHRNCCREDKILHQKHECSTFELPLTPTNI